MKKITMRSALAETTWTDALRRVCNRIALVAAAICAAAVPLSSFAEAKSATLKATGYSGSAITDFQVLVKLSNNDAYGFSYTEAGGASHNIWFTSADGATVYPHEIDKWDTSGDSFVWVRLPELASGTTFKMHWSDSASDVQPASGDDVNVWKNFVGVWHMNETGTTAASDSTGHGLSAAPLNNSNAATSLDSATGAVGDGRNVSQSTVFKVSSYKTLLDDGTKFTISGWVKTPSSIGTHPRIFVGNASNSSRDKWEMYYWTGAAPIGLRLRGWGGDGTSYEVTGVTLDTDKWYYLTAVYDYKTGTIYRNGSVAATLANNMYSAKHGDYFTIGGPASTADRSFVGTFDEVRMYDGVLSAERIAADYATMNDPTGFLTLCVAEDWTLTQDETVDGTLFVNSGVTIDLQGYKLTVNGLSGAGTITDSTSGTPGELHYVVPSGETAENTTFAFTRNMKLVVEGGGTFTASKASQSYTGGTVVSNNTTIALGTATHPLGDGNATQTVTLRENAVFNFANCKNDTTCCYKFNLYGGSEVRASSSGTRWIRLVGSATLYGDATFKGGTFDFFGGIQSAHTTLTLNGHTLYLNLNTNDGNLRFIKTLDAGSVVFSAGAASFYGSVDFSTATLGFEGSGWFFNGNSGLTASNLYFRSTSNKKWRSQGAAESYVLGTYIAGDWRAPFTMRSGATLDLSETSGTWNAGGLPIDGNNADRTQAGRVTFLSANATYTVNVGARNIARGEKIVQFVDGYSPASTVEFNLVGVGVDSFSLAVVTEGGHTYLEVTGQVPYARWVIDSASPANSGWRFYNPNNDEEMPGWTGGVTSEMEVRIYSYAEHQAVKLQNVSPFRYSLYGPFQIPSDATEWDLTSCFDILAGDATIDVNGKKLYLNKIDFAGTITDTSADTDHPGELHVTVANGTANNTAVTLTRNLKLVKEGSGTLTASKASQTYTGGTEVLAGTLALGTATHPLGDGNATQTVTVGGNGILNLATYKSESTCYYNLVLESGAEVQAGDVGDRNTGRIASITLNGNATVKMAQRTLFGGSAAGKACQLTFNGYTLTLLSLGDGNFGHVHVNDYGTFRLDANSSSTDCPGMYRCEFDLRGAKLEVTERAFLKFGDWAFYATDFVYNGLNKFTGGAVKAVNSVYGRYVAGSNRPPFTMQSGSTLDLSGLSDTWNAGGQASPSTHSAVTGAGLVTFLAANATYTVDIGTRNVALGEKIVQFTDGYDPAASVVFNLAATGAAQTPAERDLGLAVASEGGHTYLVVKSLSTPYARWVIDGANPANSGWKFYNIRTGAEDTSWTHGVTSDMEVRIYSYAEHEAVKSQGVSPMSYTLHGTFQIPSDVAAWDLTSCFDSMADGASIDVNGKKLYLNKVNFTGTITDTTRDMEHPGELHVVVPSGTTVANSTVAFTGTMRLVVEGGGTFTASKASQSYTGGTVVSNNTTIALGTATHPLGNGNATQTVTVDAGANFNAGTFANSSTCAYNFVLGEGSSATFGTTTDRGTRRFGDLSLSGNASVTMEGKSAFVGLSDNYCTITPNGYVLSVYVLGNSDSNAHYVRSVGSGTIRFVSVDNNGMQNYGGETDFSSVRVEFASGAYVHLGDSGMTVGDFAYAGTKWRSFGTVRIRVAGTYDAAAFHPPIEMLNGSTLNLSGISGALSATGTTPTNTGHSNHTEAGEIVFASGAAITVDLTGRTDLRTIAKSENPYVVTWGSQPSATFTLDAATGKDFKIEPDGTGIKITPCGGLTVFVR